MEGRDTSRPLRFGSMMLRNDLHEVRRLFCSGLLRRLLSGATTEPRKGSLGFGGLRVLLDVELEKRLRFRPFATALEYVRENDTGLGRSVSGEPELGGFLRLPVLLAA